MTWYLLRPIIVRGGHPGQRVWSWRAQSDVVVEDSRRRALRPRSFRSTRPASAAAANRAARSSASPCEGQGCGLLPHVAKNRDLGPRGDQRVGDSIDPDPGAAAFTTFLAGDPLEREDAVRTRVLPETQCHHAGVRCHPTILTSRPNPVLTMWHLRASGHRDPHCSIERTYSRGRAHPSRPPGLCCRVGDRGRHPRTSVLFVIGRSLSSGVVPAC